MNHGQKPRHSKNQGLPAKQHRRFPVTCRCPKRGMRCPSDIICRKYRKMMLSEKDIGTAASSGVEYCNTMISRDFLKLGAFWRRTANKAGCEPPIRTCEFPMLSLNRSRSTTRRNALYGPPPQSHFGLACRNITGTLMELLCIFVAFGIACSLAVSKRLG